MRASGSKTFCDVATRLAFGHPKPDEQRHIAAIHVNTITTALNVAARFLSRLTSTAQATCYASDTLVDQMPATFVEAGFDMKLYRGVDKQGRPDFESLRDALSAAPLNAVALLHMGGEYPTGLAFNDVRWRLISTILKQKQIITIILMTAQGLQNGGLERDAQALRFMAEQKMPFVLIQNFDAVRARQKGPENAEETDNESICRQSDRDIYRVKGRGY